MAKKKVKYKIPTTYKGYSQKYLDILSSYDNLVDIAGLDISENLVELIKIQRQEIPLSELRYLVTPAHIRSLFSLVANYNSPVAKIVGVFNGNAAVNAANMIFVDSKQYNVRFGKSKQFGFSGVTKRTKTGDRLLMVKEVYAYFPQEIYNPVSRKYEYPKILDTALEIALDAQCSVADFKRYFEVFRNSRKFLKSNGDYGVDAIHYQYQPDDYKMYVSAFESNVGIDEVDFVDKNTDVSKDDFLDSDVFGTMKRVR